MAVAPHTVSGANNCKHLCLALYTSVPSPLEEVRSGPAARPPPGVVPPAGQRPDAMYRYLSRSWSIEKLFSSPLDRDPLSATRSLRLSGGLASALLAGLAVAAPLSALTDGPPPLVALSSQTVVAPTPLGTKGAHAARTAPRSSRSQARHAGSTPVAGSFSGVASWYGGYFHGRRTANGEIFDTYALTAASRTLPFGTRLEVCRAYRCVVVRVNDRGPYVKGRVLDLSRAASRSLGFSGLAEVTATPLPKVSQGSTRKPVLRRAKHHRRR